MPSLRIICLLLVAAALHGCSAIKYAYNNATNLGYWYLDGYVDFTDAQEGAVKDQLARIHQWHRTQELARVAETLQRAERLAPADINADQMCGLVAEMRASLERLGEYAEPSIVALAREMTPAQYAHLERKQAKVNNEFRKDWLSLTPAERAEKRTKQLVERSEMIYGSLDDAQRALLRRQVEASSFDPVASSNETKRRQKDTIATLKQIGARMSDEQARVAVRAYLARMLESPDATHRTYQQKVLREFCAGLAVAHNATTPQQRQTAVRRIAAYQRDLKDLAGQK